MTANFEHRGKGRPREFDRTEALQQALRVFWQRGYELTTIAELCDAMGIKGPSLYAAFGNKASLFMEAVQHYEEFYWAKLWRELHARRNTRAAMEFFFREAASVLSSQEAPCGCLVALAAPNPAESEDVNSALKALREETYTHFLRRLKAGVADGDVSTDTDVKALAMMLTTLLHGMSIQARDGASKKVLASIGRSALALLPE